MNIILFLENSRINSKKKTTKIKKELGKITEYKKNIFKTIFFFYLRKWKNIPFTKAAKIIIY